MNVYDEIKEEREYQDIKWGTEFDNKNTLNDWCSYIVNYLGRAVTMFNNPKDQRLALIKVAALAVAALESFDRNGGFPPRHYDK